MADPVLQIRGNGGRGGGGPILKKNFFGPLDLLFAQK